MPDQCVITRKIAVAKGVYAPGHLGELTQVLDFDLIDAVARETGTVQQRTRLLPTRVVIYLVLALALFEHSGYRRVWAKMTTGLRVFKLTAPTASALVRARRRVDRDRFGRCSRPWLGAWAARRRRGCSGEGCGRWRSTRRVCVCPTGRRSPPATRKRSTDKLTFGYPLLRLSVLVECGTRAILAATFGPEADGETTHARR